MRRAGALLVAATLAAGFVAACSPPTVPHPSRGGTLGIVLPTAALQHVDPQRVTATDAQALLTSFVFRTLTVRTLSPGADSGVLLPDLATDTGSSPDGGTTWVFRLRTGVVFDNAVPLTCEDVRHGVARNFARELGNDGTGVVAVLDVPLGPDGLPTYLGPYAPATDEQGEPVNDVAAFDRAVQCDGDVITFRLRAPDASFPEALTLPAFAPVPVGFDIGQSYDLRPVGTGPYRVDGFVPGRSLSLIRNDRWSGETDPHRPAWPDTVEVRLDDDTEAVARAVVGGAPVDDGLPADVWRATVGPDMPRSLVDALEPGDLLVTGLDGWERHLAINTRTVTEAAQRAAVQAAIDRAAYRDALVGEDGAELTDGVVAPSLGLDHRPTGLWGVVAGGVDEHGDPAAARALLAATDPPPPLTYDYPDTGPDAAAAAVVVASLQAAGFRVTGRAVPVAGYRRHIENPDTAGDLVTVDWAPPVATGVLTVAALLGRDGALNVSGFSDPAVEAAVDAALAQTDRGLRADPVSTADRLAAEAGAVVPMLAYRTMRLRGPQVGGAYIWPPYGTWAYGALWVRQGDG